MKNRVSTGQKRRFFALFFKKTTKKRKMGIELSCDRLYNVDTKKIKLIQGEFL